jgi:hypothetical protein
MCPGEVAGVQVADLGGDGRNRDCRSLSLETAELDLRLVGALANAD